MLGLVDQIEETPGSDVWVPSASRFTNVTGTPLVSADANDEGEALAAVYALAFSSVVAETSAVVTVTVNSSNNPYRSALRGTYNVDLDGTTVYKNIVPGVNLVFSDSSSFAITWSAQVRVGRFAGVFPAFGAGAGVPGAGRRHRVENTGSGVASNCAAQIVTQAILYKKVGTVFEFIRPFAENGVEKTDAAPYAITVENKAGSGTSITADIKVDGALVDVKNLTTLAEDASEALNVVDEYEVIDGGLEGLRFKLSQSIINTATANVLIFENLHTQIAPDVAGAAGTYGTTDVELTEDGEAAGEITGGGVAHYWERAIVQNGANNNSNPRPGSVRLTGEVGEGAGWGD